MWLNCWGVLTEHHTSQKKKKICITECIQIQSTHMHANTSQLEYSLSLRLCFHHPFNQKHFLRLLKSSPHISHNQHTMSLFSHTVSLYLCAFPPISCSNLLSLSVPHLSSSVSLSFLIWKQQVHFSHRFSWLYKGRETEKRAALLMRF